MNSLNMPKMVRNKQTRLLYRVTDCLGRQLILEPVLKCFGILSISITHMKRDFEEA